ncbi:MAG: glycine--tRNA ligase [Promicromonosporaceae bacterium]|nr:glycine--tRNA ligase [Promicromonosporaceae bacterium]
MDKLVNLCKTRGYIYPGSELYGGLANTWDYGPLGVELNSNIKRLWWQKFVQESPFNVGLDSGILLNPQVWVISGHAGNFNDPLIDCRKCKSRFRADKLIAEYSMRKGQEINADGWSFEHMKEYLDTEGFVCPECGAKDFTDIRRFNMMFKTHQGVVEDSQSAVYMRPETAQGIFINFKNLLVSTRRTLPLGVCQIGKSFRNEITPGNFIFRTREFEQMEMEFFCSPESAADWFDYWRVFCRDWLFAYGIKEESVVLRDHSQEELSHYSDATTDIEFHFPFGWGELWGIANRTDFDLKTHTEHSGKDLTYRDPVTNEKFYPYVIEPSAGLTRSLMAFLVEAYDEDEAPNAKGGVDKRVVLRLDKRLAPYKVAVLPLSKSDELLPTAEKLATELREHFSTDYDVTQAIGKRYRRQDEIGTPYCVTVDFDTLNDDAVTIRDRDTMEQVRVPLAEVKTWLASHLVN